MRILHVGDDFAALRPCGLTRYAESLMQALAAGGHDVTYVFSGRHHPRPGGPRVHRWRQAGVAMVELLNAPMHGHPELGTRRPDLDVAEPVGERAVADALAAAAPDVVHVQELARLPSSVLDVARDAGVPVVATLHDYKPVCASVRLLDADGRRCTRTEVGEDCARNCAGAPPGPQHLIDWTLGFERGRVARRVPLPRIDRGLAAVAELAARPGRAADLARPPRPADYQRRRDVAVARLSRCERLVAPSARVAELYAQLGVAPERLAVQRLTLPHLEHLRPRTGPAAGRPLRFVTLGGAASRAKGSHALSAAVAALAGRELRLDVWGGVDDHARAALAGVPGVRLRGPYATGDLDRILDDADVGLLPSVWEETHGFVGIELLAKGVPVIGSALGGITEYVVPGRTGWLNHSATGEELAALMAAAMDDPAGVEALRAALREDHAGVARPMAEHVAEVEALYAGLARA